MKIIIDRKNLKENPAQFMRRAGYGFIQDRRRGTESFARRITREHYPRFHVYIKDERDKVIFDMHLDQKRATYAGAHAHNAEYDGPVVEREINRLKQMLNFQGRENKKETNDIKDISSLEERIGNRDIFNKNNDLERMVEKKKKSWFRKIFG